MFLKKDIYKAKYIIKDRNFPVCSYHFTYDFQSESTPYSLPECQGTPSSKLNVIVFVYKLSGCGFESLYCHIGISSDESDDSDEKSPDEENSDEEIPMNKSRLHNLFLKKKKTKSEKRLMKDINIFVCEKKKAVSVVVNVKKPFLKIKTKGLLNVK